ncbi:single-stranded DNA-binding protein [Nonomuraea africana]|uniref:Single-stranded DNA-binding protein n=1 Tax=Nonomuraea africana TaxID=46171 RepID=A0ABR9KH21_9ACTN|nr:single-stranded DNA-binding protein [Nonomuraea africana]MBE1560862.1 single-stranded DNA-binding protein [Nonomuraea africana]
MDRNDVTLVGRLSASPDERAMPSGDTLTKWRIIVRRDPHVRRGHVDTIQCVTFDSEVAALVKGMRPRDPMEVRGALRCRIYGPPSGKSWRYEVEVHSVVVATTAEILQPTSMDGTPPEILQPVPTDGTPSEALQSKPPDGTPSGTLQPSPTDETPPEPLHGSPTGNPTAPESRQAIPAAGAVSEANPQGLDDGAAFREKPAMVPSDLASTPPRPVAYLASTG